MFRSITMKAHRLYMAGASWSCTVTFCVCELGEPNVESLWSAWKALSLGDLDWYPSLCLGQTIVYSMTISLAEEILFQPLVRCPPMSTPPLLPLLISHLRITPPHPPPPPLACAIARIRSSLPLPSPTRHPHHRYLPPLGRDAHLASSQPPATPRSPSRRRLPQRRTAPITVHHHLRPQRRRRHLPRTLHNAR